MEGLVGVLVMIASQMLDILQILGEGVIHMCVLAGDAYTHIVKSSDLPGWAKNLALSVWVWAPAGIVLGLFAVMGSKY